MATLGNVTVVTAGEFALGNTEYATALKVTASEHGKVTDLRTRQKNDAAGSHSIKAVIWDASRNVYAVGGTATANSENATWYTMTFSEPYPQLIDGTVYYIGFVRDDTGGEGTLHLHTTGASFTDVSYEATNNYAVPESIPVETQTAGFNMYVTYTPSSPGATGSFTHVENIAHGSMESMGGVTLANTQDLIGLTKA